MAHELDRFGPEQSSLLRPESGIKGMEINQSFERQNLLFHHARNCAGLYFTGQDVTSTGFGSCVYSGFLCASAVLNKKYSLLYELYAQHKRLYGPPKKYDDLFF